MCFAGSQLSFFGIITLTKTGKMLRKHTFKMIFFFFTHIGCEHLVEAAVPCKKWHQQGCAARSTLHSDIVGGGGLEGLWECGSVCVCE